MSRKQARETAFKIVYGLVFDTINRDNDIAFDGQIPSSEQEYIDNVVNQVVSNLDHIDTVIQKYAKNFSFERVFKIDLACLRLGIAEILYTDTPGPVAITSVVELAKKYSTEKSASYVNGVLAAVFKAEVK